MKTLEKVDHTNRGFELIKFKDAYGMPCSLQQSSLAEYEQPGSSAVWLGSDLDELPVDHVTGNKKTARMHLKVEQVEELITRLQAWVQSGSFKLFHEANPPTKEGEKSNG